MIAVLSIVRLTLDRDCSMLESAHKLKSVRKKNIISVFIIPSSIFAGMILSGKTPICLNKSRRLGDAEAKMSLCFGFSFNGKSLNNLYQT